MGDRERHTMHNEKDRERENVQFESAIPMLLNMSKIGLNQLTTELFHWLHSLHCESPLSLLVQMKDKMKPNLDQLSLQLRNRTVSWYLLHRVSAISKITISTLLSASACEVSASLIS